VKSDVYLSVFKCIKAVLLHLLKHYVDSVVLQEVVYYSYNGKKKANNRQTIITLKSLFPLETLRRSKTFDLQEIGGKLCIICPNHKFKISLVGGEGLCKAGAPREEPRPPHAPRWYSKGVKQRVHVVTETAGGDIYVRLSEEARWMESDFYQGEKGEEERAKAAAAEEEKKKKKEKKK